MEGELQKIREGVLALMDKNLIQLASTDESKVLYYKMKSDYYPYLAECATDDAKGKATEDTRAAYAGATKIAEKDLVVTNPVRLAMALNSSVVAQKQIPMVQSTRTLQCIDKVVDDPVVQIPQMQVVDKTVEGPQVQIVEQIVETPKSQTIQGIQTSESLDTALSRQVHPTDVVKPDDPDAKLKFLVKEMLHGVGGFVFDAHGNSVANELREQNCVTGEMWKNEPPFSLALNKATSDDIAWQCKHYTGCGVRRLHESGTASVEDMEAPVSKMPDSIEAHCQASLKTTRNPNGEPYPAFTSDKSWDEASGKTVAYRQVPLVQRVQKTVEVPQIQFIDKLVDSHVNMRSVPEVEHVVPTPVTEHMASAPAQSHADVSAGVKSDITWTTELTEIRQMVEFLVRRERKLDVKTDVAVRRLERLEREQDEQDDHDREASMTEAFADKTKVVKLVVDKWFVDRGFGFGKVPTGEIVFIHASAVVGAEVLTIGTDAWVQVVNDDARAQEPRECIEPDEPGDKTCGKQTRTKRKRTRWPNR